MSLQRVEDLSPHLCHGEARQGVVGMMKIHLLVITFEFRALSAVTGVAILLTICTEFSVRARAC